MKTYITTSDSKISFELSNDNGQQHEIRCQLFIMENRTNKYRYTNIKEYPENLT